MKDKSLKRPRFGVLDFVIILLIIVAVVGVYFRYNIITFFEDAQHIKEYNVTYSIKNIRHTTDEYINNGDKFYFVSSGEELGENTGILGFTSSSEFFPNSKGELIEVVYPYNQDKPDNSTRIDVQGRMLCSGRYSNDGEFFVNGSTYIAAGQYIDVRTEYVTVTIRIDSIDQKPVEER